MTEIINKFDVNKSADYVKDKYTQWQKRTVDIVKHLHLAKEHYSNSGYRSDLVPNGTKLNTFDDYLNFVGIAKRTVYNWLNRYNSKEQKLLTLEEVKAKHKKECKQQKERLVNYKITGIKPKDWEKKDDKEYLKHYDEELRTERLNNAYKEKDNKKLEREATEIQDNLINDSIKKALEIEAQRAELYKKFETDGTLASVLDIINIYIDRIKNDSGKIEASQNIIKYCRNLSIKLQAIK